MEASAEAPSPEMVGVNRIDHVRFGVQNTQNPAQPRSGALGEVQRLDNDLKRLDQQIGQEQERNQCPGGHSL